MATKKSEEEVSMLTRPALHFEMSSSIAKLALAQTKVQKEIKDLPKESKGFAHKYTTFDKLVQYLRPILSKHGISFIQMPCGDNENVGVITLYMHTSGEYISSKVETQIIQAQNKYQSMGSAITYFKRYSLASFVGIASDEDTDGNVQKKEVKKPTPTTKPLTDEQFKTVIDTVKDENEEFRDKVTQAVKAQKLHQDNYMDWLLEYKESKTKEGKNGK
tara:strand:+ start:5777 stop:6430 length:654 start_codon:yes stop_codon:yes gene_type:complete